MYPNIEAERVRKGLSQVELAKVLGIAPRTYSNWMAGRTAITSTMLKKMSTLFDDASIDYLLVEHEGELQEV